MYIALHAALMDVDVDEIMLPIEGVNQTCLSEIGKQSVRHIIDSTNKLYS